MLVWGSISAALQLTHAEVSTFDEVLMFNTTNNAAAASTGRNLSTSVGRIKSHTSI